MTEKKNSTVASVNSITKAIAMIFDLKSDVINSEPSVILGKFLKYPNEKNIKKIMKEAFKYSKTFK